VDSIQREEDDGLGEETEANIYLVDNLQF
jgi:hypothetical protein